MGTTESCGNIPENTLHGFLTALTNCRMITTRISTSSGLTYFQKHILNVSLLTKKELRSKMEKEKKKKTYMDEENISESSSSRGWPPSIRAITSLLITHMTEPKTHKFIFPTQSSCQKLDDKMFRKCEIAVIFLKSEYFYLSNSYTNNLCP